MCIKKKTYMRMSKINDNFCFIQMRFEAHLKFFYEYKKKTKKIESLILFAFNVKKLLK